MHGALAGLSCAIECLTGCAHGYGLLYCGLRGGQNEHAGTGCAMTIFGSLVVLRHSIFLYVIPCFWQPGNNNSTFDISNASRGYSANTYILHVHIMGHVPSPAQASPHHPRSPGSPGHGPLATFFSDRLASSTHLPPPSRTLPVSSWCIFRHQRYLISSTTASLHANSADQPPAVSLFGKRRSSHHFVIADSLSSCQHSGPMISQSSSTWTSVLPTLLFSSS